MLEFRVLGSLEAYRDGRLVPLGGPQQRRLLAVLLIHANAVLRLDSLVDLLQLRDAPPDGASGPAATTVQKYVHRLRAALEPDRNSRTGHQVLRTRPPGYVLAIQPAQLDAARFATLVSEARRVSAEHPKRAEAVLREALGLWRGDAWAEFAADDFARAEAFRLEELRAAAVEDYAEAGLALGRHADLIGELEAATARHPLRERPRSQLILALYRCGRHAEALAVYQSFRRLLADELGLAPPATLQQLEAAVLLQKPELDLRRPAAHLAPAGPPPAAGPEPAPGLPGPAEAAEPAAPTGPAEAAEAAAVAEPAALPEAAAPAPLGAPADAVTPAGPRAGEDARPAGRPHPWARTGQRAVVRRGVLVASVATLTVLTLVAILLTRSSPRQTARGLEAMKANAAAVIDPHGPRLLADVPTGQSPDGIAVGAGAAWAVSTEAGTVSRVDLHSRAVVQTVQVGRAPAAAAVADDDVWVADSGSAAVSRVDAVTNQVVRRIRVGNVPSAIAAGPSGVWVANRGDATVIRIDPASGSTAGPYPVGGDPDGIAVAGGAVWVANAADNTVTRLDTSGRPASDPIPVGAGPAGIAATPDAVWVANALDQTVYRIDPVTNRLAGIVRVGDGPTSVAVGAGGVWVTTEAGGALVRIDPRTMTARTLRTGAAPRGVAVDGNRLWVTARAFPAAAHRGGTLVVAADLAPWQLDPAVAYDTPNWSALSLVYDGLVGFRRASGTAGLALVPDLAIALPHPTDGGRTYTFTLRRGIRYSDGVEVTPGDVTRGLRRELTVKGGNQAYYAGIVGGAACLRVPARCDLSRGVTADPAGFTVTFHLVAPDPDFLYKLAMPWATVTSPRAPGGDAGAHPFPGTGPYAIADYKPGRRLTLVRNRFFRQWSASAQPYGYPDSIRWRPLTPTAAVAAVDRGGADIVDLSDISRIPETVRDQLRMRNPGRLHEDYAGKTLMLALNTRLPPFDDARARRALAFAVDRSAATTNPTTSVACQLTPPNFPGYSPYCPYTARQNAAGQWNGPDLDAARRLVEQSGTRGASVDVWALKGGDLESFGHYLVGRLTLLGYRPTLHLGEGPPYFQIIGDSRTKAQVAETGWAADFPAASNYYFPILSCSAFTPNTPGASNVSEYCDPSLDALANRALAAQATDPGEARRLWIQVNRKAVDAAAVIPTFTGTETAYVSERVGNYQEDVALGVPFLDQIWVR